MISSPTASRGPTAASRGPTAADAVAAARRHAEDFAPAHGRAARLAIVACMDRRLDVMSLFGLRAGQAYIIRNAGGILTDDVRRSLAIAQHVLGVEEILLVHHTDCGMRGLDDSAFVSALTERTGAAPLWRPGGFASPEADLRFMLDELAADPHVPGGRTARGFIYDVGDGTLTEVLR